MYGSLLPKANGGGDRRDYAHSKRAIQRSLSSVFTVTRWQGDTSFSTFRLARGQAGTFGLIFPACPRESKSSEFPVTSVTLSPGSRLFPRRKSKTYDAKVRDLRPVIHWLTTRITSVNSFKIKQAMEIEVTSGANRVKSVTFIFMLIL